MNRKLLLAKSCSEKISKLPDQATSLAIAYKLQELKKYDPSKAVLAYEVTDTQSIQVRNYTDVFALNVATLSTLKKYRGEAICKVYLITKMRKLAKCFKIGKGMDEDDLTLLADLILEDFYYLTIADLKLFSKNCLRSVYGKSYDRFDIPTILDWLAQYVDTRFKVAAEQSKLEKKVKKAENAVPMPDYLKKLIKVEKEKPFSIGYNQEGFKHFSKIFKTHLEEEYKRFCQGIAVKNIPSIQEFSLHRFLQISKQVKK